MKKINGISLLKKIIPYPVRRFRAKLFSKKNLFREMQIELQQLKEVLFYENQVVMPPPKHLQVRIVGGYAGDFIASGYRIHEAMENAVKSAAGVSLGDFKTIYDFGCGCGRITRAFKILQPSSILYGSDIDPEAIGWLKKTCSNSANFHVNSHVPPLEYEKNLFDFVFSISIFTHLPEDMQFLWLEELRRIVKPGGYLFLTTHGERYYATLSPVALRIMKDKGFYYSSSKYTTTEGLPSFYQSAYHSHEYIRKEWSRYFKIKDIKTCYLDTQDAIILQKSD
jgi:2-polyprenyl-3-methyl-5-hydroxy-6-metoxy-1,4-benzoquinol methylase